MTNALETSRLICRRKAGYSESCKSGLGASIWKPTAVMRHGAGCLAYLDVTGSIGLFGSPMTIAREISARIRFELGITVSIGVSNNKITAKLGSDYKKPDAITRIGRDNYKELVYPLPVEDLLYVGPATSKKLRGIALHTIGRLAECPEDVLQRRLGKIGPVLKTFALGNDVSPVQRTDYTRAIKSVGNSATTPRDLVNNEDVHLMLLLLAESVAARMREISSKCTVVEVSVRDKNLYCFTRQHKLKTPTCSSQEIALVSFELFKANYRWWAPIRSIGVRGAGLVPSTAPIQLSLYQEDSKRQKWESIDRTVDELRRRYGYMAVQKATIYTDPLLGHINPVEDHTVHPVGFFGG